MDDQKKKPEHLPETSEEHVPEASEEYEIVFRRFRRGKDGKVYDAWAFGYRAWPMRIKVRPTASGS